MVFKSVDESLAAVFGLTIRDAVYLRLLTKDSLTRDEIPKHLVTFQTMLEDSFGQRAAKILVQGAAKRLYSELKLTFKEELTFSLAEYVDEAKLTLLKANRPTAETVHHKIRISAP